MIFALSPNSVESSGWFKDNRDNGDNFFLFPSSDCFKDNRDNRDNFLFVCLHKDKTKPLNTYRFSKHIEDFVLLVIIEIAL